MKSFCRKFCALITLELLLSHHSVFGIGVFGNRSSVGRYLSVLHRIARAALREGAAPDGGHPDPRAQSVPAPGVHTPGR